MVFFSTYKSSRLVAKDAFKAQTLRHRCWGEYILHRSWAGTLNGLVTGECRLWIVVAFALIYGQRFSHYTKMGRDENERNMINRWGGTLEEVRKNLSPADQARANAYYNRELYLAFMGPKDTFLKPEGMDLPDHVALPGAPAHH